MPRRRRRLIWYCRFKTIADRLAPPAGFHVLEAVYALLIRMRAFKYRWIADSAWGSMLLAASDRGMEIPIDAYRDPSPRIRRAQPAPGTRLSDPTTDATPGGIPGRVESIFRFPSATVQSVSRNPRVVNHPPGSDDPEEQP